MIQFTWKLVDQLTDAISRVQSIRQIHAKDDLRGGRDKGKKIRINWSKDLQGGFRERDNGEALDLPSTARD